MASYPDGLLALVAAGYPIQVRPPIPQVIPEWGVSVWPAGANKPQIDWVATEQLGRLVVPGPSYEVRYFSGETIEQACAAATEGVRSDTVSSAE